MPLTKEQKQREVAAVACQLQANAVVYLTDYKGLTVDQVNDLRQRFRNSGVEYRVVKNTLLRRAMEETGGYDALYEYLQGPMAVAFSNEPAAAARVIKDYTSDTKLEVPELRAAFVDGGVFASDQLDVLASLRSKDEIIGDIVGLLLSPISQIIGAIEAPGTTLAAIVAAMQEREEG